jgi:hypothetical protein
MVMKHGKIISQQKQQMAEKSHKTPMEKKTDQTSLMKDISNQIPIVA